MLSSDCAYRKKNSFEFGLQYLFLKLKNLWKWDIPFIWTAFRRLSCCFSKSWLYTNQEIDTLHERRPHANYWKEVWLSSFEGPKANKLTFSHIFVPLALTIENKKEIWDKLLNKIVIKKYSWVCTLLAA